MTPEELDHIRTTTNNATPGPWHASDSYNEVLPLMDYHGTITRPEDSTFIANSRTWIPQLLDYIDDIQSQLAFHESADRGRTILERCASCHHIRANHVPYCASGAAIPPCPCTAFM